MSAVQEDNIDIEWENLKLMLEIAANEGLGQRTKDRKREENNCMEPLHRRSKGDNKKDYL